MATNVIFTRGNTATINATAITDGQILYDTTARTQYLDNGTTRLQIGQNITVDATLNSSSNNPIANSGVAGVMHTSLSEISTITQAGSLPDALAVKELNSNLKWKYTGTKTGTEKVYVPISANEIFISCHNSEADTSYYNIPMPIGLWSSGTTKQFTIGSSGAQIGGSSVQFNVTVQETTTTISVQLVGAYIGNQDKLTNSDISVFYR